MNYFILFIIALYSLSASLEAATFHALLIGDTVDDSLGEAIEEDMHNMHSFVKRAAHITQMDKNEISLKGSKACREKVLDKIEELEVDSDDVIFAYFSMHGYRVKSKSSRWPDLFFNNDDAGVDLNFFKKEMEKKKPRLLVIIADCCNVYVAPGEIVTWRKKGMPVVEELEVPFKAAKSKILANYQRLFLGTSGTIVVSGSEPGQPSYGSDDEGSLFTLAFINCLEEAAQKEKHATWEIVLTKAVDYVLSNTNEDEGMDEPQVPQYQITYN